MRLMFLAIIAVQAAGASATVSARPLPQARVAPRATSEPKTAGSQAPNVTAAAVKAFQDRLGDYVAFRNKVEATVPQLTETSDPAKISSREHALGEALIKTRGSARPGDYFIKQFQP